MRSARHCLRLFATVLGALAAACSGAVALVVQSYGYVELRPPSMLLQPGAVVWVKDDSPFIAGVICPPEDALGPKFAATTSATNTSQQRRLDGARARMGAEIASVLRADARFEHIRSVEASLTNARVVEVDDAAVLEHLASRTPECHDAIARRMAGKFKVTMISSALVGDVVYRVSWQDETSLDLEAKRALLGELAPALGAGHKHVGDSEIGATGLVWGLRDDEFLAALSIPSVDEAKIPRGTRVLSSGLVPQVKPDNDLGKQ